MALVLKQKRSLTQAADHLGVPINTLNVWVSQARNGTGVFLPDKQKDLAARVRDLEAECRRLRIERDILKEAMGFFTREEGSRP